MQKLDFLENLNILVDQLQSEAFVQRFNGGFSQPGNGYDYGLIKPTLFSSKSSYDRLKDDERFKDILDALNAPAIYSEQNLALLTTALRATKADSIIVNANTIALYNFHNTLLAARNFSQRVLTSELLQKNAAENVDNGIVIFQILVDGDGLETEKYIRIFSALQELINTLSKVIDGQSGTSEVILLDSGSDTNVGIKTSVETAKSLFLVFKEIWDFITNFRHYKMKQKNQTLLDSLSIRAEIKRKVEEGVLSEEEGREYMHMIKTRTDDLIGMKVMPKQIVADANLVENKRLLAEFEGIRMLSGNDGSSNEAACNTQI